jgi:hypothetical protein
VANELLVLESIHVTISRTGAAIRQFRERTFGTFAKLATTIHFQVGGLEALERKTPIRVPGMMSRKHD